MTSKIVAPCLSSHLLSPPAFPPVPTAFSRRSLVSEVGLCDGRRALYAWWSLQRCCRDLSVVVSLKSPANDTT
jgi:hypothetical protein